MGCGFLGGIVADAYAKGLLPDYELLGVASRTKASAQALADRVGCRAVDGIDELLALKPDMVVETASVECVRAIAEPVLRAGCDLVVISIGAFADAAFYDRVKAAAIEGGARVHIASGAIGGFDVLQTVTLMAQAQSLPETAGIDTHTGCRDFMPTPVWEDALLTEEKTVFTQRDLCQFEDFEKIQLVVAKVLKCEKVPKADKLLMSTLKVGDTERVVVSGIAKFYTPEEMVGKKVVLLANLAPRKIRGVESHGMLLCAANADDSKLSLLTVDADMEDGCEIG